MTTILRRNLSTPQLVTVEARKIRPSPSSLPMRSSPVSRTESMAYPSTRRWPYLLRRNDTKAFLATLAFCTLVWVLASDSVHDWRRESAHVSVRGSSSASSSSWGGAVRPGYFRLPPPSSHIPFAAITDLDQLSRIEGGDKPQFRSLLAPGTLQVLNNNRYEITFAPETRTLTTKHNEAGRGAEFSELTLYQNRLLTFDDRTGDVFEILNTDGTSSFVVPRFVVTEGNGETDKGMKWEWATVKQNELYMGSMGKEYTRPDGSVLNRNNLWIGILNANGDLRREDWTERYKLVRQALNAWNPGYLIIEAVLWSDALQKWVFLPRRISHEMYDEHADEQMGGHQLVLVDDKFTTTTVVDIKMESLDGLKGFSSFAFVPGTGDKHALAIRSVEEDCVDDLAQCKQRAYMLVFNVLTGEVLSEEVKIPGNFKYEGVEFVDLSVVPK